MNHETRTTRLVDRIHTCSVRVIRRLKTALHRLRYRFVQGEWLIRLLGLSKFQHTAAERGLVMVQIDGLSHTQLRRALASDAMPFLNKLIDQQHYKLQVHYSGLPSSTPAMQAELFYGVKTAVPTFSFRDRQSGSLVHMFKPVTVATIERELAAQGEPLLKHGSAYLNVFTGGATESHFCTTTLSWGSIINRAKLRILAVLLVSRVHRFVRMLLLLIAELVLALSDCLRGWIGGQNLLEELKFVPTRLATSILLREWVVIRTKIDLLRGLPIIHLNFLGYDEQSHRRGPASKFAHQALPGIDTAIGQIWRAAKSARRDYAIWVYSDHGQEHAYPYAIANGRTLKQAVATTFTAVTAKPATQLLVAAPGPIAIIYCGCTLDPGERAQFAKALASDANIPLVLATDGSGQLLAWTETGHFRLPKDKAHIFGADHPFLTEVSADLVELCHHLDAGDFVLLGWRHGVLPCTFTLENGAHAGAGPEETKAFALLPSTVSGLTTGDYARPLDLRQAALRYLDR